MAKARKAVVAGVLTAAASLSTAAQDGAVDTGEWITAVVAAILAGVAVYATKNAPSTDTEN
jgi:uncharacterized membrane protein